MKKYKPSNFSFKLLLTLTPDTLDIFSGKFLLKKSKNISGISPGYPGYIFEGTPVNYAGQFLEANWKA